MILVMYQVYRLFGNPFMYFVDKKIFNSYFMFL